MPLLRYRSKSISVLPIRAFLVIAVYSLIDEFSGCFVIIITLCVTKHMPEHFEQVIQESIKGLRGKLEIYLLPPYAPDLNPDELVWNQMRNNWHF